MNRIMTSNNKSRENAESFRVVGFFLLVVPVILCAARFQDLRGLFTPLSSYRQTSGTILSSRVRWSNGKGGPTYRFDISYQYEVGGQTFKSNKVRFDIYASSKPKFAESYVQKYPSGRKIVVFFLPDEPSFAALEPQQREEANGIIGVPIAFFITGCLLIYFSQRAINRNSAQK